MKRILIILISVLMAVFFVTIFNRYPSAKELSFGLIESQTNAESEWTVCVYGIRNTLDGGGPFLGAEHIRLANKDFSRFCVFRPLDVSGYALTPNEIWSPDGMYLVLCDGQHEGFIVFRTNDLPNSVRSTPYFIANVVWNGGYRPVHQFLQWVDDNEFMFCVLASGITETYRCNLETSKLVMESRFADDK